MDGALGRHDLTIDAAHSHIPAIRTTQYEAKSSAHFQIDLADSQRPAARPEPALEQLRLGERVKNKTAGGIKHPRHNNLAVCRRCYFQSSSVLHRIFPYRFCQLFCRHRYAIVANSSAMRSKLAATPDSMGLFRT